MAHKAPSSTFRPGDFDETLIVPPPALAPGRPGLRPLPDNPAPFPPRPAAPFPTPARPTGLRGALDTAGRWGSGAAIAGGGGAAIYANHAGLPGWAEAARDSAAQALPVAPNDFWRKARVAAGTGR